MLIEGSLCVCVCVCVYTIASLQRHLHKLLCVFAVFKSMHRRPLRGLLPASPSESFAVTPKQGSYRYELTGSNTVCESGASVAETGSVQREAR